MVTFRDVPEAITQGDDEAESIYMARNAQRIAMDFYVDEKRPVPLPSKAHRDNRLIDLPISVAAKVLLFNEMLAQKVGASELGRRIGITRQAAAHLTNWQNWP